MAHRAARNDAFNGEEKNVDDEDFAAQCDRLRRFYASAGRAEWWWIMDDAIAAVGRQLQHKGYCVVDGFLTPEQAINLQREVEAAHRDGHLEPGGLVNGRQLDELEAAKYADTSTRGDVVGWFDSDETSWPHGGGLGSYLVKLGTLVRELGDGGVDELRRVTSRSKAMVACYPGGGSRYVKHVDNDGKHPLCRTRLLTALLYLNADWSPGDGGELVIFKEADGSQVRRMVEPVGNRLLLFWSDWRTPHEVRPAHRPRYAVTLWLLDRTLADVNAQEGAVCGPSNNPIRNDCSSLEAASSPKEPPETARQALVTHVACDAGASNSIRYEWRQLDANRESPTGGPNAWELSVAMLEEESSRPSFDLSDTQVRVLGAEGEPLLCLPLPLRPIAPPAPPKWSSKRRQLTARFDQCSGHVAAAVAEELTAARDMAAQLKERGWGFLDGFLTGPQADDLRKYVFDQRGTGRLKVGGNSHEGPTSSRQAKKNDEYAFVEDLESNDSAAEPLRVCARKLNKLIARLMQDESVPDLKDVSLLQGRPMLAVYPGDGAHYGRHYDAMSTKQGDNGRRLTMLVYLNPFWREEHGGQLRLLENLAADSSFVDVDPLHGRLVGFLCHDRCPHEVRATWADRAAVTFWYYDRGRLTERCRTGEDISGFGFEGE